MYRLCGGILSALLFFGPAAAPVNGAAAAPLGVIVAADHATVGNSKALSGSTLFPGDRLATAETGQMQLRLGGTQARLLPGSLAVVNQRADGVNATLLSGSIALVSPAGDGFSVSASGAVVRPASRGVAAQITRVSPSELLLSSNKGTMLVTFEGETTTIAAGSTYRMLLLDTTADEQQGPVGIHQPGRSRKRAIFIIVGAAAAATGIAIAAAQSSSPVSPSAP